MNGLCRKLLCLVITLIAILPCAAQDRPVNGYTYIAPSVYPAPPIVVYDPAFLVPSQTVISPLGYGPPASMIYAEPAFMHQTVMPSDPTWAYAPPLVGPSGYRERVRFGRQGVDYSYRAYAPGRSAPVYSYRVDPGRHGVRIRERVR